MIVRDYFFACAARNTLLELQKHGIPVWLYHFTYPGDFIESPILGKDRYTQIMQHTQC